MTCVLLVFCNVNFRIRISGYSKIKFPFGQCGCQLCAGQLRDIEIHQSLIVFRGFSHLALTTLFQLFPAVIPILSSVLLVTYQHRLPSHLCPAQVALSSLLPDLPEVGDLGDRSNREGVIFIPGVHWRS